jgi:hypothetical protein
LRRSFAYKVHGRTDGRDGWMDGRTGWFLCTSPNFFAGDIIKPTQFENDVVSSLSLSTFFVLDFGTLMCFWFVFVSPQHFISTIISPFYYHKEHFSSCNTYSNCWSLSVVSLIFSGIMWYYTSLSNQCNFKRHRTTRNSLDDIFLAWIVAT